MSICMAMKAWSNYSPLSNMASSTTVFLITHLSNVFLLEHLSTVFLVLNIFFKPFVQDGIYILNHPLLSWNAKCLLLSTFNESLG